MSDDIIGKGWRFPPRIGRHGGIALVGGETEIEQAILIILRTAPGQRVMRLPARIDGDTASPARVEQPR